MFEFENTYDAKIMSYKGDSIMELSESFEPNEVEEMKRYLKRNYGYDLSYLFKEEEAECVTTYYIQEWLIENIRNITYSGTDQLYRLVFGNA